MFFLSCSAHFYSGDYPANRRTDDGPEAANRHDLLVHKSWTEICDIAARDRLGSPAASWITRASGITSA